MHTVCMYIHTYMRVCLSAFAVDSLRSVINDSDFYVRYFAYALSKTLIGILRIAKLYSHYCLLSDSETTLINSITKNVLQSRLHYISISRVLDNTVNFVSTTAITTHSILSCFHVLVFFHHLEKIFVQNFKFGKLFG